MKKELKGIGERTVVHCPTEESAVEVLKIADAAGYKNRYDPNNNRWSRYGENTCYNLIFGQYGSKGFFESLGNKTITAEEFIRLNTAEPEPKFKVGDKVTTHRFEDSTNGVKLRAAMVKFFDKKGKITLASDNGNYLVHGYGWPESALDPAPKENLSGLGYSQFSCKKPGEHPYKQYEKTPVAKVEKNESTVSTVIIPLDEVLKHVECDAHFASNYDRSNLILWLKNLGDFYAQQPQLALEHTNTLTSKIEALEKENKALKNELAVFTDLALNQ